MAVVEIFSQENADRFSKVFRVDPGRAVVISSFNFSCAAMDDEGSVTSGADCAVLHKIEMGGDALPERSGCCGSCVVENLQHRILGSEPVVQCGQTWTHTHECNLSVLSVPGYYMFEVCNPSSVGSLSIKVEDLSYEEAALIPKNLFHGS